MKICIFTTIFATMICFMIVNPAMGGTILYLDSQYGLTDQSSNHFTVASSGVTYNTNGYYFDGTDVLTISHNSLFNINSKDVTIDMWVNFNAITGYDTLISHYTDWEYFVGGNDNLILFYSNTNAVYGYVSFAFQTNRNYHIAVVKTGNQIDYFVDGQEIFTGKTPANFNWTSPDATNPLTIGNGIYGYLNATLNHIRISDEALWSTNFDVNSITYGVPEPSAMILLGLGILLYCRMKNTIA